MNRKLLVAFSSFLLLGICIIIYACTDKEVEAESVEFASTRSLGESLKSKYYHILPGTEEWKSLQTGKEMWDSCQLSEDMLKDLSTEELIEACMEFPMAYDFIAADTERKGIAFAIEQFNGLTELVGREDAVCKLIEEYGKMDFNGERIGTRTINTSLILSMAYTELLLVNERFMSKMTSEEQDLLKSIAEEKYMMKLEHPDYFGLRSIEHSLVICAELALARGKSLSEEDSDLLHGFVNFYQMWDPTEIERISMLVFE